MGSELIYLKYVHFLFYSNFKIKIYGLLHCSLASTANSYVNLRWTCISALILELRSTFCKYKIWCSWLCLNMQPVVLSSRVEYCLYKTLVYFIVPVNPGLEFNHRYWMSFHVVLNYLRNHILRFSFQKFIHFLLQVFVFFWYEV